MNNLTFSGIVVLILSVAALVCGNSYLQRHQADQVLTFFTGKTSSLHELASFAVLGGVISFFVGLAIFIAGLVRGGGQKQPTQDKE